MSQLANQVSYYWVFTGRRTLGGRTEDVQTKRVAFPVAVGGVASTGGDPAVAARLKHDVVLSPQLPPATERRSQVGEDDSSHLTPVGLQYRWHRRAVVNIYLAEVFGLRSPASERLEIRNVQKMQQAARELAHQVLKTYLGGLAVWLTSSHLPGEA